MFSRVSTVPLCLYANYPFEGIPDPDGFYGTEVTPRSGVLLGKVWSGSYSSGDFQRQIENGWIEYNYPSGSTYPEYTMPDNLPEWVNAYNPSTHPNFEPYKDLYFKRFLLGDGTDSLGPFTLHEALYIYSVLKKYKSTDANYDVNSSIQISQDNPFYSFTPKYKNLGIKNLGIGESGWYTTFYGYGVFSSLPFDLYVVADVDNLSDYYICNLPFAVYFTDYSAGGLNTSLLHTKGLIEPLVQEGEIEPESGLPWFRLTFTPVTVPATYSIGSISANRNLHGYTLFEEILVLDEDGNYSLEGGYLQTPPPSSVTIQASEFWPYKNANGQPVYNETTGAIINPPIP
jgi:hypothetical protein